MKRTSLLQENLLEEATRLSGEKTYSGTVDRALKEFVLKLRARQILTLAGQGLWSGSPPDMRGDHPRHGRTGRRRVRSV